ncbi:MAG TPA: SDR family oxidoreductase [Steroidobacteraceae bacterium]|nr:SDR family oxidoreductase [Steroidobacteraceae bacterium]
MRFLRLLIVAVSLVPALASAEQPFTVLITGSNKGIGLELTRIYAANGWKVIATCRNPQDAAELQALAKENPRVSLERLDVTDHGRIDELAKQLKATPIDHLVNNAGITAGMEKEAFGKFDFEQYDDILAVNTIAPLKMAEAFIEHVAASRKKTIVNISSSQGSIESVKRPGTYFYRASKAALNMEMRNLALDLAPRGIIVGLVGPGLTQTNLTRNLKIPMKKPDEAAKLVFAQIEQLTPAKSGVLVNYDGAIIPW